MRAFKQLVVVVIVIIALLAGPGVPLRAALTGTVRFVIPNGATSGTCTSWASACDLQRALAVAVADDELWVVTGIYKPTTGSDRNATFQLVSGIRLYGGFIGNETAVSQRNWTTNVTTLSGDIGIVGDSSDNVYHVVTANATGSGTVLDGFTVTDGRGTGQVGGGVFIQGDGRLTISNCRIANNWAEYGGGVFEEGSNGRVDVSNSRIELNTSANHGGGLYVDGSVVLTLTQVTSNTALFHGGGLHVVTGRTDLIGGLFSNNVASTGNGGAVNVNNGIGITGTRFISNTSGDQGGGLTQWNAGQQVTLADAYFERNATRNKGGGASIGSAVTISNSTFLTNTANSLSSGNTYGGGVYASNAVQVISSTFNWNEAWCNSCPYTLGGGLDAESTSPITVERSWFEGNHAWIGGGVYTQNLLVQGSSFLNNQGGYGAGIRTGNANIQASRLVNNHAVNDGGGVEVVDSLTISSTRFYSNTSISGGAIWSRGDITVTNTLFAGDQASRGALYLEAARTRSLQHVTIAHPTLGISPAIVVVSGTLNVSNTLITSYTIGISYTGTIVNEDYNLFFGHSVASLFGTGGAHNLGLHSLHNQNPRFVNPTGGDYHLGIGSPAVNAGTNLGVMADLDGTRRDAAPDVGVYEIRTCWARLNNTATDYGDVQSAIEASTQATDLVKVAGYCPGVQTHTGVTQTLYLDKSLTVRGGYTTTNWTASNPAINVTTLDALGRGRVAYITGNITPTLEDLRLTNGSTAAGGGGLYALGAHPVISGCQIYSNTAAGSGGGAYFYLSSNTVWQGNQVYSNTAGLGGGGILLMSSSNALVSNNQIHDNKDLNGVGGGIYLDSQAVRVNDNHIYRNFAGLGSGGGIYLGNSFDATLMRNRVYSNTADYRGGGLFVASSPTATLINNQIYSNTAILENGGGLNIEYSSAATLQGNQIYGNASGMDGGGVCVLTSANVALSDNEFYSNTTSFGGGIYIGGGSATLAGNQVYRNTAWYGGGLYLASISNTLLAANLIYRNTVNWYGGGVFLNVSSSRLVNNIIANNQATGGSGLGLWGSSLELLQTTLARNTGGEGIYVANSGTTYSSVAMTNTILSNHTVGITVTAGNTVTLDGILWFGNTANAAGPGYLTVQNAVTGDPAFTADGYHLTSASNAIDSGVDSGVTTDIDGDPRPLDNGYELGADEFRRSTVFVFLPLILRH